MDCMKYVAYLGETVLTSDGVGDAVMDYARDLVVDGSADVVDIPVLVDHSATVARMLIGYGSPMMVLEVDDRDIPLDDEAAIAELRKKSAALGPHHARPTEPIIADPSSLAFDYL